jgi:signal peptidase II
MKFDKEKYFRDLKKSLPFLILEAVVLAGIIALDLTMKEYLYKVLSAKNFHMTLIKGFIDLTYSENTGAGFGIFKNGTQELIIVTSIVTALIVLYLLVVHSDSEWLRMPLVFIAAGGIGNLVDRIMLGYVRDFFEFTFFDFAIFNIADAFVVIGCIWLIIYLIVSMIKEGGKQKQRLAQAQADAQSASMEIVNGLDADPKTVRGENGNTDGRDETSNVGESGITNENSNDG